MDRTPDTPRVPWPVAIPTSGARTPTFVIDLALLGARLYAGLFIARAGFDKLPTPDWMVDQVRDMNFPFEEFSATAACITEAAGGLLLIAGLFTRPVALALAVVMGFAAFNFQGRIPVLDYHIAQSFFWFFVAFAALGGGRFSVDAITRAVSRKNAPGALVGSCLLFAVPVGIATFYEVAYEWEPPAADASEEITIESVSIAGGFNGWFLDATPMTDEGAGVWGATLSIDAPGVYEMKFAANSGWELNVGAGDETVAQTPFEAQGVLGGGNIRFAAPRPGSYRVTLDTETLAYTVDETASENEPAGPPE